ncbi:GAF and ANTAR domain-containing protein [Paenarthrobacter sp. NPDC018779]|uniref:GAF and ANTAR domain-containing protein n=1 Tax=Paenarthrobacter sp. NPDC018779 TaxID=3364375 RepID=UPI0037C89F5F
MNDFLPLVNELAALAGTASGGFLTPDSASKAVQSLAYILRDVVPGSVGAGASLINARGRRESSGATDLVVLQADQLQYELGQGHCLSAWAEQRPILIDDTQADTRWPAWSAAVADLPIRSVLSAPLTTNGQRIGALKVYSPIHSAFDNETLFLIERLAAPAAVLLGNARDHETTLRLSGELMEALTRRDAITRAQGILMERHGVNARDALDTLLTASRDQGRPLHQIAELIVHEIDGE